MEKNRTYANRNNSYKVSPTTDTLRVGADSKNRLGSIGQIVELPLLDLDIGAYQKALDLKRVEKIVSKFDIDRMRPIDVSFRDGKYYVFDGQHRANAYYLMGFTHIPAIIHRGLTYEDEAYLFARQQDEVGSVTLNHKWNALVQAKDPETMEIIKVCKEYGFTVLAKNNKGNNIKCVKMLTDMYRKLDAQTFRTILSSIAKAWNYMDHSVDVAILGEIAKLATTYPQLNYFRLVETLQNTTPKLILRDMEDKHHGVHGEVRRAAYQVIDVYNKSLPKKSRLDAELLK